MLANTVFNLKKNKKLNIGYYGGSITLGGCADDPEKESYRALLTNWFRTQYPDVQIREIQAAISGTGSELGMHRCESDLLNENPDLIFLEYTVNDYGIGYEKICAQFETIIRMIYVKNPFADIVVLTTITEETALLQTELDKLKVEQERLERMLEYMQTDDYLLQYAREKLGYVFPNDIKFFK